VTIDSCYIGTRDLNIINSFAIDGEDGILTVTRSFIGVDVYVFTDNVQAVFDHNTFVMDSRGQEILHNLSEPCPTYTNNIFLNIGEPAPLLYGYNSVFRYNCLFGYEPFMEYGRPLLDGPDSTNLIANPLLDWEGISWLLSPDSPSIDAGDPNAPRDPDGTRSDIGARSFYNRGGIPHYPGENQLPQLLSLMAYPNPFNSSTTISFGLDKSAPTRMAIYDIQGKPVAEINPPCNSRGGLQSVVWDASSSPAGSYFVRIEAGGVFKTERVILVR
jgi:hypothetical protein